MTTHTDQHVQDLSKALNEWAYNFIQSCITPEEFIAWMIHEKEGNLYALQLLQQRLAIKYKIHWIEQEGVHNVKILMCGEHKGVFTFQFKTTPT